MKTTVVRCRECHLVYQRPFLLPEGNPYEAFTGEEYFRGRDPETRVQVGRGLARHSERLLGRKGRLLDLGCGRGDLLEGARQEGWAVAGVEMTASYAAARPDLNIEVATVANARSFTRTYDVVWLAAILEHLYDPAETLLKVHAVLPSGGLVFIDVPNECSLWSYVGNAYMRLRGRRWAVNLSPTFPPFHVVGFCPRSLRRLLVRSGFADVDIRTHRWQSELPQNSGMGAALERLGSEVTLSAGARIGMGGGITCWARK